jgi:hypothetical protein
MQRAVIEWNNLTSQSKIYFSDLLPIISWTHPVFSGVYGKIHHILNGLITERSKRRTGSQSVTHGIRIRAARNWGSRPHGIGGSWRITEESVLSALSALSIRTTIAQLFQTSEVAV